MGTINSENLDRAVASYMMKPDSRAALRLAREVRTIMVEAGSDGNELVAELCRRNHEDCLKLHDAVLTLESDPEIVKRNLVARAISGIFPVLNAVEEFRTFEDRAVWDVVINSIGVLAEIATATQYLESTRLQANAHNERSLVEIEERLVQLARGTEDDHLEKIAIIEEFLDEVRDIQMAPREKPIVPFIIWSMISVISYKELKDHL